LAAGAQVIDGRLVPSHLEGSCRIVLAGFVKVPHLLPDQAQALML
jgi:hypothetical protein